MRNLFQDLMDGLDEVDVFLSGKTAGYRISLPVEVDIEGVRKRMTTAQSGRRNSK
jgi:hypothetical protein